MPSFYITIIENKEVFIAMNFQEFKLKIFNFFHNQYDNVSLADPNITIIYGTTEIVIDLKEVYAQYNVIRDFDILLKIVSQNISKGINTARLKVDYGRVFPYIQNIEFGNDVSLDFVTSELFLNLKIVFGMDMGELIRFLIKDDKTDIVKIQKNAFINLEFHEPMLYRIDRNFDVFTPTIISDLSPAFVLLETFRQQIFRKTGKESFLFAIPSSAMLMVADCSKDNIPLLKHLVQMDIGPNKISDKIYIYRRGTVTYADARDRFTVI